MKYQYYIYLPTDLSAVFADDKNLYLVLTFELDIELYGRYERVYLQSIGGHEYEKFYNSGNITRRYSARDLKNEEYVIQTRG